MARVTSAQATRRNTRASFNFDLTFENGRNNGTSDLGASRLHNTRASFGLVNYVVARLA